MQDNIKSILLIAIIVSGAMLSVGVASESLVRAEVLEAVDEINHDTTYSSVRISILEQRVHALENP
jgi:hypothetical protein